MRNTRTLKQPARALIASAGISTNSQTEHAAPFLTQDPEAAYTHFLSQAEAVAPGSERRLSVESSLARHNVDVGVAYFVSIEADIVAAMPACPVNRYEELPSLALALMFACDQVVERASDGEIHRRLNECGRLRAPMLKMLEVLADPIVGIADSTIVKDIRAGTGPMDKARDAVNIAAYFRRLGPAAAGKHPFSEEQIRALAEHGHWLIPQLTPGNAVVPTEEANPAMRIRDQLWTLLWDRYDQLRGAVAAVCGLYALDEHVPPLGSRLAPSRIVTAEARETPANKGPAATGSAEPPAKPA